MLLQVVAEFQAELDELVRVFTLRIAVMNYVTCAIMNYSPEDDGLILSLWDLWNRFMRTLYLTCANGPVNSISNSTYSPTTARSDSQAISVLATAGSVSGSGISLASGEPKWFMVRSVQPICSALGLVNGNQISSAVGVSKIDLGGFQVTNPITEVQTVRNHIAHKSVVSAARVAASYGVASDISTHIRQATRGGSNRFLDWCDAFREMAWLAAA